MTSLYRQFRSFHVIKKFKSLLSQWWNIDLFLIERGGKGFFYSPETELNNQVLKALLNSKTFREDFMRKMEVLKTKKGLLPNKTYDILWEKTGFHIFAVPLLIDGSLEGAVACAGFKSQNEERLRQILGYLNYPPEWAEKEIALLKAAGDPDSFYIKKFLSTLTEESFLLFQQQQKQRELIQKLKAGALGEKYEDMIGKSPCMQYLFGVLKKVRRSESPILIQGENGTGKELIAKAIYKESRRAKEVFIAQNCSAFNDNLLESELFGHKKGSFSGAFADKKGLFEAADKGTFFLDEIGDISPSLQAKLLRALQEGEILPVGGSAPKKVDVRIISATNKDLSQMISEGKFREDLFYRLNVINIKTPPLRDRLEDIPLLTQHFISRKSEKRRLSPRAMEAFCSYSWPGNVRELENEVERLLTLSDESAEIIGDESLSLKIQKALDAQGFEEEGGAGRSGALSLQGAVRKLEKKLILKVLREKGGNRTHAAKRLNISRTTLLSKVKEHNLTNFEDVS